MLKNQLSTSWHHIRRVPFQALSATFVLTITFFVISVLAILVYSSGQVLKFFETRPQVIAFLKEDAEAVQVDALRDSLKADTRVRDVKLVSKEEALSIYKSATSDNPLLSELVSPAIFPSSVEFSLTGLSFVNEVLEEVKANSIVDSVGFTASFGDGDSLTEVIERLRNISWYIKVGGGGFAAFLVGTSFLILIMIIGMRITSRRGEYETLELLGATPSFIRRPVFFEAMAYVLFGVVSGWVLALLITLYATPSLINYFGDIPVLPKDTLTLLKLFGIVLGLEVIMGFILAFTGGALALSRGRRVR